MILQTGNHTVHNTTYGFSSVPCKLAFWIFGEHIFFKTNLYLRHTSRLTTNFHFAKMYKLYLNLLLYQEFTSVVSLVYMRKNVNKLKKYVQTHKYTPQKIIRITYHN